MVDLYLSHPEVQSADLRLRTRAPSVVATEYVRTASALVSSPFGHARRTAVYGRSVFDELPVQVAQSGRHFSVERQASLSVSPATGTPTRVVGYVRSASDIIELQASAWRGVEWFRQASAQVASPVVTLLVLILTGRRPISLRVEASGLAVVELDAVTHLG